VYRESELTFTCLCLAHYWSGIGWRDGALGATPGQLHNSPIVPAAGPASRYMQRSISRSRLVSRRRPGVPARFRETDLVLDIVSNLREYRGSVGTAELTNHERDLILAICVMSEIADLTLAPTLY